MLKIIPYAHQLISEITKKGDNVVDATCGNGNDTLFLSQLVGKTGHVYAFDLQKQAINQTQALLEKHKQHHITYIHDSHALIGQYIPKELHQQIRAAIFNLGYLPGSDKSTITQPHSTIQAIEQLFPYLKKGARIVLVVYHGHEGGEIEKAAVVNFAASLDQKHYAVIQYRFINQKNNPPFVIGIEKK